MNDAKRCKREHRWSIRMYVLPCFGLVVENSRAVPHRNHRRVLVATYETWIYANCILHSDSPFLSQTAAICKRRRRFVEISALVFEVLLHCYLPDATPLV